MSDRLRDLIRRVEDVELREALLREAERAGLVERMREIVVHTLNSAIAAGVIREALARQRLSSPSISYVWDAREQTLRGYSDACAAARAQALADGWQSPRRVAARHADGGVETLGRTWSLTLWVWSLEGSPWHPNVRTYLRANGDVGPQGRRWLRITRYD